MRSYWFSQGFTGGILATMFIYYLAEATGKGAC